MNRKLILLFFLCINISNIFTIIFEQTNIYDIPEEILYQILEYVSQKETPKELIKQTGVNKTFKKIITNILYNINYTNIDDAKYFLQYAITQNNDIQIFINALTQNDLNASLNKLNQTAAMVCLLNKKWKKLEITLKKGGKLINNNNFELNPFIKHLVNTTSSSAIMLIINLVIKILDTSELQSPSNQIKIYTLLYIVLNLISTNSQEKLLMYFNKNNFFLNTLINWLINEEDVINNTQFDFSELGY